MNEFLEELYALLEKHNATIIRSANATNSLVLSVGKVPVGSSVMKFTEIEYDEDITKESIKNKWYRELQEVK
jgi:hypothetical protein